MKKLIAAFAKNTVFANIFLLALLLLGILAAVTMNREFFPEFSTDVIMISVLYPGADPEEVEEGISRKIEDAIDGLQGIKQYNTISNENLSLTYVEVAKGNDTEEVKDRVRNQVDAISTFPPEAEQPIISEILIEDEVVFLALWGDLPEKQLKEWAEDIKDELQNDPEISQVKISGTRDYEIAIEVSEERLREYGITFAQVSRAVRRGSMNLSGGTIRTKGEEIRIRTVGRKYTGQDFASIIVMARPNGEIIRLDRLATIRDDFTEDPLFSTFNGERCANIEIYKTSDEDAIAIAERVRRFAEDKQKTLPANLHVTMWGNRSELIEGRIRVLTTNGIQGLVLVFLLLWLFLDFKLSFWVAMGLPISFCGALGVVWMLGGTINMISLFGLIMVLGILVDDSIVVGEAIYVHRRAGKPALQAAVDGAGEVAIPVIAAVTTNIVAFIPLWFVAGIMGKFIAILPTVVIACMVFSLFECLLMLPAHLSMLAEMKREVGPGHPWKQRAQAIRHALAHRLERFASHGYGSFVALALRWRYVTLATALAVVLVTVGLVTGGLIKFVLFPPVDGNDLNASIEFPDGTPLEVTKAALHQTQQALERVAAGMKTASGQPLIKHVYAVAGEGTVGRFGRQVGSQFGRIRVELLRTEDRGIHYQDIIVPWEKEIGRLPGAISQRFGGVQTGPGGAPIEVWLQGNDLDTILAAANELKEKLQTYDGVYQIEDDFRPGKNELRVDVKPDAHVLGLTLDDLARQLYAGYYGEEADRLQRGRDDVRVKVRYPESERKTLGELENVRIRTPQGFEVPFLSVAQVDFEPGYANIKRTDGQRRVSVTAEVNYNIANAAEVLGDLREKFLSDLTANYPGVAWSIQGEQENTRESVASLRQGFVVALLGVFVIICTIFRSYVQTLVIMVTIPFGIIGAVYGHLLFGLPLTMLSLFGIVTLAGVVVNDAIVLIECFNNLLADNVPFYEALKRAGIRRFRAIVLTSVTTMGGLAPLIMNKDMQAQFLIPMALSIAAGVAFSTLLTLVFIPCLLAIVNDIRKAVHRLVHGVWPTAESLEPAVTRLKTLYDHGLTQTDVSGDIY
ncbi:MAG: efflux RND transporter permease subunit [Candidatus Hydrogenedentes bacterium]|nr:efflux RND transporter permease subunit [Candidatus Hydrogenedentota bacterium]